MNLTNDAKKLLYLMYKEYRRRRKDGMERDNALFFDSSDAVHELLLPDESSKDTLSYLGELKRAGYVSGLNADNIIYGGLRLTYEAVTAIEQRPGEVLESVASFLANFIP